MAMAVKEKVFVVWFFAVAAFSVVFSNFWSWAAYALQKTVALGFISFTGLAVFVAEVCGVHFLP
jgi:hypothetical protein